MTNRIEAPGEKTPISLVTGRSHDSQTPFANSKIMIVDDEPTTIEILEVFLEGEGYEHFVTTTDSREALELARREQPDVLLLDLMMPHVGGLEVLGSIRADENLRHLPVVILTSSTEPEIKLQALELGATDLLAKPVDPSELALRLRNTLTAKVYQDRLAYYDQLTGLPNRRLFLDRLDRGLTRAGSRSIECALLYVNLNRFGQINDALGRGVGDRLLCAVARRLEESVRPTDFLGVPGLQDIDHPLSRVGGDEFALLLPCEAAFETAVRVARRILSALSLPFGVVGQDLFVTASIGVAMYPSDGDDIESLLTNANAAVSHAKEQGRNNFEFYDASLNSVSAQRLTIENQLRGAIERKELELFYQPKLDVGTSRIIGAEALMRWEHPELGRVGPDQFIPIAEQAGLISSLGTWALRSACQQIESWRAMGLPQISIAVNVSAIQFREPNFVDTIQSALTESRLDPGQLILELTESVIMDDTRDMLAMLGAIKQMGVRISVDDFGTGYSSLSSLKHFPIDELKVDRSFVQNVPHDEDDAAIVSAVIVLGHSLGLTVVAEGIETPEQLAFIHSRSCDTYQGYLRSRPVPANEFERLLRAEP